MSNEKVCSSCFATRHYTKELDTRWKIVTETTGEKVGDLCLVLGECQRARTTEKQERRRAQRMTRFHDARSELRYGHRPPTSSPGSPVSTVANPFPVWRSAP